MVGPWAVRLWTVGGVCLWPVGGVPVGCGRCACRLHCLTCQHCVGRWPVCPSAIAEVLYDAEVDMEAEVPMTAAVADIRRCGKPTVRSGACKVILKPGRKCPYHG